MGKIANQTIPASNINVLIVARCVFSTETRNLDASHLVFHFQM
jgi:hypothetical protein